MGADRALKRLALQRVRDIDLWKAALCGSASRCRRRRKKLADADIDIPAADRRRRQALGWLSDRALRASA